jgi:hypothetical protein
VRILCIHTCCWLRSFTSQPGHISFKDLAGRLAGHLAARRYPLTWPSCTPFGKVLFDALPVLTSCGGMHAEKYEL